MSAERDIVLGSLARARKTPIPPPQVTLPPWTGNLVDSFAAKAHASAAQVHQVPAMGDVPARILAILRGTGISRDLHIAPGSPLHALAWPELIIAKTPPAGDEPALCIADYGIAETGSLVFCSGALPSSWHFLPGLDIVLIDKDRIVARFEDVVARVHANGAIPATVNLITGPSRTADIEQTIEMGAHGPREIHIVIVG